MLEVQLNEMVGIGVLKELAAVKTALGDGTHELTHAQVAIAEQRLSARETLALHHILIAEYLAVHGTDQSSLVVLTGSSRPVLVVTVVCEAFDAQIGSINQRHGEAD